MHVTSGNEHYRIVFGIIKRSRSDYFKIFSGYVF